MGRELRKTALWASTEEEKDSIIETPTELEKIGTEAEKRKHEG